MINLGKLSSNGKEVILEKKLNGCIECISHCKDDCGYTRIEIKGWKWLTDKIDKIKLL